VNDGGNDILAPIKRGQHVVSNLHIVCYRADPSLAHQVALQQIHSRGTRIARGISALEGSSFNSISGNAHRDQRKHATYFRGNNAGDRHHSNLRVAQPCSRQQGRLVRARRARYNTLRIIHG
jgi:hypothetical protein